MYEQSLCQWENLKLHRTDENDYIAYQTLWDGVESDLRETCVALNPNIKKEGNYW